MLLKEPIKRDRLLLCFAITFILTDTCPYPNWQLGFIEVRGFGGKAQNLAPFTQGM